MARLLRILHHGVQLLLRFLGLLVHEQIQQVSCEFLKLSLLRLSLNSEEGTRDVATEM